MQRSIWRRVVTRIGEDGGQTLVEYALILLLVSITSVAVLGGLGTGINSLLNSVSSQF